MTAPLLDDRLRALSVALEDAAPPSSVDRAIAAAIASKSRRPNRTARRPGILESWLAWPVALVASIFAISIIVRQAPAEDLVPGIAAETLREAARTFTPVVSADEIARAGDAYLMPARLPRMTLAQLGFPVNPERIGEAVETELLVRADGAVLALRFVH
jgi:hypothetical protein